MCSVQAVCKNLLSDESYIGSRVSVFDATKTLRPERPPVLIYRKPTLVYTPDSDIETCETSSGDERVAGFSNPEYRITGIIWHTPRFLNTCNMDSFLSAWVRCIRQTHGKFLDEIKVFDTAAVSLFNIADHALCAKNSINATLVKELWLAAILKTTNEAQKLRLPVLDCLGRNMCSVFQHLAFHSSYVTTSSCLCGVLYHRNFNLEISNLAQIYFVDSMYDDVIMPKCTSCNTKRKLLKITPDPGNWLLPIAYNGTGANRNPPLASICKTFNFGGLDLKLEYIAYSQLVPGNPHVLHEVSLQNIHNKWYLYDGAQSPKFRLWKKDIYDLCNARLTTLVYFKM
jgi:hypothetical protein